MKHLFWGGIFTLISGCASVSQYSGAKETAAAWDEIYDCVRTAPRGKSCGIDYKQRIFTTQISTLEPLSEDKTLVHSRFGLPTKVFSCPFSPEEAKQLYVGKVIRFQGTVNGITNKPFQQAVEFQSCKLIVGTGSPVVPREEVLKN